MKAKTLIVFLIYGNFLICDAVRRTHKISYYQKHSFEKLDSDIREMSRELYSSSDESLDICGGKLRLQEVIIEASGNIGIFRYENPKTGQTNSFFAGVDVGQTTKLWKLRFVGLLCSNLEKMEDSLKIYLDDNLRFHPNWTPSIDFLDEMDKTAFEIAETEAFHIVNRRSSTQFIPKDVTARIRPYSLNVNIIVAQYTSATAKTLENGFFTITVKRRAGEPLQLVYVSPIDSEANLVSKLKNSFLLLNHYLCLPQTNLEDNVVFAKISNKRTVEALVSFSQTVNNATQNKHLKLEEILTTSTEGTQRLAIFSSSNSKPPGLAPNTYLVAFKQVQAQIENGDRETYKIQYLSNAIPRDKLLISVKEFTDNPYAFLPIQWVNVKPGGPISFENLTNTVRNLLVLTYAATDVALVKYRLLSGDAQIYAVYEFNILDKPAYVGVVAQRKTQQPPGFRSMSTRHLRRSDSVAGTISAILPELGYEAWDLLFLSAKMVQTDSNLGAALNRYRQDRSKSRTVGEWIDRAYMSENTIIRFENISVKLASIVAGADVMGVFEIKTISQDGTDFIVVYSLLSGDQQLRFFFASISMWNKGPDFEIVRYVSEPTEDLFKTEYEAQEFLDSPLSFVDVAEDDPCLAADREEKINSEVVNFLSWKSEGVSAYQNRKVNLLDDRTEEIYIFRLGPNQNFGYVFVVVEMPYSFISYVSRVIDKSSLELEFYDYKRRKPSYLEEWILPSSLTTMAANILNKIDADVRREEAEESGSTKEQKISPLETNLPPK